MIIKLCGITQAEQALAIDLLGADMLGTIFYALSKRFVGENLPFARVEKAQKVGVFVDQPMPYVIKMIDAHQLDYIQLHGSESVEYCRKMAEVIRVIKAFGITESFDFNDVKPYEPFVSYFLFDTASIQKGGSGKVFDWQLLNLYNGHIPFLLSGGLGLGNFATALQVQHNMLAGFDINSKVEITPGVKNLEKVKQIINELRSR